MDGRKIAEDAEDGGSDADSPLRTFPDTSPYPSDHVRCPSSASSTPGRTTCRDITVDLPHRALIVITGPSGSGKSTLAFDTLYAEGQRRYIESLSTYAKQFLERMPKPLVDRLEGIAPVVAIEQRNPVDLQPLHGRHRHRSVRLPPAALGPDRAGATAALCGGPVRRDTPQSCGRRRAGRRRRAGPGRAFRCRR